tara:strand:- start:182 stop:490 length:309 start_codon:yes stop_codon:yes gene_type:complete
MFISKHESTCKRRRAYQTETHLVFQRRNMRRCTIDWQKIIAPVPYHPDTPQAFLDQLLLDWTESGSLKHLPTAWLQCKPIDVFAAAPSFLPSSTARHARATH